MTMDTLQFGATFTLLHYYYLYIITVLSFLYYYIIIIFALLHYYHFYIITLSHQGEQWRGRFSSLAPPLLSIHQLGTQGGWASRLDGGLYDIYEYIENLYTPRKTRSRSIALRFENLYGLETRWRPQFFTSQIFTWLLTVAFSKVLDRAANDDVLFEEMVTFYHQNRTSGSLPAHLDENDCFTLSAILKILDWGVYYESFIFEITKRMKYFPHHLFKRSKNCKTSVENFYFVYPFSEKKIPQYFPSW